MKNDKNNLFVCSNCGRSSTLELMRCPYCREFLTYGKKEPEKKRFKNQVELFEYKWNNCPHISEISGTPLGDVLDVWFMLHILNKKNYPKFKLDPDNILIGTPDEHFLIDHGTQQQRNDYEMLHGCSFDIFYEKQEKLKKEYPK